MSKKPAPLVQPSKTEIARRYWIELIAEQYRLPSHITEGAYLSLVQVDEPGVEILHGDARRAVEAMFRHYPTAKTRDGLTAAQSAINLARMEMAATGLEVDTTTEEGKPFGLAMVFFHKAIEDGMEKITEP